MTPQQSSVKHYITNFPEHGNRTLAKMCYKEHPTLFQSLDAARCCFRRARGAHGVTSRAETGHIKPQTPARGFRSIPKGLKELGDWKPTQIQAKRLLIISDIHIPFHSDALTTALKHGKATRCDTVLINGDFIDFYGISRYVKDPRLRDLGNEIETARKVLDIIAGEFKQVIWKIGNHEERWENYLFVKAPELIGVADFEMEHLFKRDRVSFVSGRTLMKFGKLHIVHGHEFGKSVFNPVNAARGYFLRSMECMLGGHLHQTSTHSQRTMADFTITTWSTGCLCDLHPHYAPFNKWNQGFATAELTDAEGNFLIKNHSVIHGQVY